MARGFLQALMPHNIAAAEDFPVPEFAEEPAEIFENVEDVMAHLENSTHEQYSLLWDNIDDDEPFGCMLYFTEDGGMIAGVAVSDDAAAAWMKRLASVVNGRYGYITGEEPPPSTAHSFIARCVSSQVTHMIDGKIHP